MGLELQNIVYTTLDSSVSKTIPTLSFEALLLMEINGYQEVKKELLTGKVIF